MKRPPRSGRARSWRPRRSAILRHASSTPWPPRFRCGIGDGDARFPSAGWRRSLGAAPSATGENLIEQIAAVGDYMVALATYHAAVKRWPKDKITLRNRARVIEQSWRD